MEQGRRIWNRETMQIIATFLAVSFAGLAILHLYWAGGGSVGLNSAVPTTEDTPIFTPGPVATTAVALLLAGFAMVALALGFGWISASLVPYATFMGYALGIVLILRAVGEFRYVGVFKRIKTSKFARYDTWLFSPFCLLAGLAFLLLAANTA